VTPAITCDVHPLNICGAANLEKDLHHDKLRARPGKHGTGSCLVSRIERWLVRYGGDRGFLATAIADHGLRLSGGPRCSTRGAFAVYLTVSGDRRDRRLLAETCRRFRGSAGTAVPDQRSLSD